MMMMMMMMMMMRIENDAVEKLKIIIYFFACV